MRIWSIFITSRGCALINFSELIIFLIEGLAGKSEINLQKNIIKLEITSYFYQSSRHLSDVRLMVFGEGEVRDVGVFFE